MSCRIDPQSYRAFEERHSWSLNVGSRTPQGQFVFVRTLPVPQLERVIDFLVTEPITEPEPSDAVLLLLITILARHLIRCSTPSYRYRRDVARSARPFETYYVPRIDYELHFSALDLWLRRHPVLPAIFRQGQALHPATMALIETAIAVGKLQDKPLTRYREEYECLSENQLLSNLIGERMRAWYAYPANATRIKAWEKRLDTDKQDFLELWTPADQSSPQQLLRFDLFYAGQTGSYPGFGAIPADVVKKDVDCLREELASSPNFSGLLVDFFPYADFTVTWMIPGLSLVPAHEISAWTQLSEIRRRWQKITGPRNGRFESNYTTMAGDYRYVSPEQLMFDPLWLQLSRAATYLFDTRLILESSLDALTSADSFRPQPPAVKQSARSKPCAF